MVALDCTSQNSSKFRFNQRVEVRIRTVPILLVVILIYFISSLVFSAENLPDYASYESSYDIGIYEGVFLSDPVFVALNKIGKNIGLTYEQFRILILILSLSFLSIALIKVDRWLNKGSRTGFIAKSSAQPLLVFLMVTSVVVFLLEFFSVRIRAGLSLSLVSLAFSFFLTACKRSNIGILAVVAGLIIFGYGVHRYTAITLAYFLFFPYIYGKISRSLFSGIFSKIIVSIILLIVSFYFLQQVVEISRTGRHLESPLNIVRLVFISVIPCVLIALGYLSRFLGKMPMNKYKNISNLTAFNSQISPLFIDFLSWIDFSKFCYFGLALTLFLFEVAGHSGYAGEALVRVFTLSSVVSIFILVIGSIKYLKFWLFLLLVNSIFFVNTLLTPYGGLISHISEYF